MSGRSSPADTIEEYLRERENFGLDSVTTYQQLTNPREDDLFPTPGHSPPHQAVASPFSDANNYPSPVQQVQYYTPEFSSTQGMEQPPLNSLTVPVPGYTEASPASPCEFENDSAYYGSSPHSSVSYTSPTGSPMPCPTASQYFPVCTLPETMPTMDQPASSSLPLTCSSIPSFEVLAKPVYSTPQMGFYPPMQGTQAWGCDDSFVFQDNLTRATSHTSVFTEAEHRIQYIDTNSPSHSPRSIDYYPPTPESPENRPHCPPPPPHMDYTGLHQLYEFAQPQVHVMNYPRTTPSPKAPMKQQRRVQKKIRPPVQVDDSEIKDIPTSAQLWEFTLRVLKKPKYSYMVSWENKKDGLFRFGDAQAFAALWGKHRNRPSMTYDKVARALRYYYKRDILNQVGGRLTYKFSRRLGKLYASE